ncbi:efflux transporter outer membrane subunit [Rhodoferax sp. PAMC 29310]|uniref:efflux transporter outer membrane subunit n=1 Tax=Rhodoferax sp. PAMC 29310 TaxID=2822760 RepID=UPI001B33490A|nr:efflux transporter outer membrane subunit [Rhodoferax sp. PAMC 29310]
MTPHFFKGMAVASSTLVLSACSVMMPATQVPSLAAPQWQAPLPHQGRVQSLANWWQRQGDPLLVELIDATQAQSPSMAQALTRIAQARANQAAANAVLLPQASASAGISRGVSQPNTPVATSANVGLQASWELDLVGANKAVNDAAFAQLQGTQAQWHNARVSVAAEVAQTYYALATCTQLLTVAQADSASRADTARLTELSTRAGFTAPAMAALARASAAEARSRVTSKQESCDLNTKALVALTGMDEAPLRQKLALALVQPAQAAPFSVATIPAQTLTQRPDVFSAERDVVVASAQVGSAKAQRYPRLTLNGAIGGLRVNTGGTTTNLTTWSFGPLAVSVPLFDGGQRVANISLAETQYQQAVITYRSQVRQAVREVEDALIKLQSTDTRQANAEVSRQGYAQSLAATQVRFDQGLASLVELEEARRVALAAQSGLLGLALERNLAWVALYRTLGGGWDRSTFTPDPSTATPSSAP